MRFWLDKEFEFSMKICVWIRYMDSSVERYQVLTFISLWSSWREGRSKLTKIFRWCLWAEHCRSVCWEGVYWSSIALTMTRQKWMRLDAEGRSSFLSWQVFVWWSGWHVQSLFFICRFLRIILKISSGSQMESILTNQLLTDNWDFGSMYGLRAEEMPPSHLHILPVFFFSISLFAFLIHLLLLLNSLSLIHSSFGSLEKSRRKASNDGSLKVSVRLCTALHWEVNEVALGLWEEWVEDSSERTKWSQSGSFWCHISNGKATTLVPRSMTNYQYFQDFSKLSLIFWMHMATNILMFQWRRQRHNPTSLLTPFHLIFFLFSFSTVKFWLLHIFLPPLSLLYPVIQLVLNFILMEQNSYSLFLRLHLQIIYIWILHRPCIYLHSYILIHVFMYVQYIVMDIKYI